MRRSAAESRPSPPTSRAARRATSRVAAALCHGWLQSYAIDEFRLSTAARACPTLWRGRQSQEAWPTRRRSGDSTSCVAAVEAVRLESGAHVYVATAYPQVCWCRRFARLALRPRHAANRTCDGPRREGRAPRRRGPETGRVYCTPYSRVHGRLNAIAKRVTREKSSFIVMLYDAMHTTHLCSLHRLKLQRPPCESRETTVHLYIFL